MAWLGRVIVRQMRCAETLIIPRRRSVSTGRRKSILSLSLGQRLDIFETQSLMRWERLMKESPCNDTLLHCLRLHDYSHNGLTKFPYAVPARFHILSKLLDIAQYHCHDLLQVFHTRIYLRSKSSDDSNDDLIKYQVISRVLDVTKRYPKVKTLEVTEESQFQEDLGLDESESKDLKRALQVEFKLYIPDDESCKIHSCKLAIDYIYNHRMERLCMKDFWKKFAPEEPQSEWHLLLEPRNLV